MGIAPQSQQSGISIIIDGATYFAPRRQMTGNEIRHLPAQAVGQDRDLWKEVDGDLDQMIRPEDYVELQPQMRFFTVPKVINPGRLA